MVKNLMVAVAILAGLAVQESEGADFWKSGHLAARKHFLNPGALDLPKDDASKAPPAVEAQRAYYTAAILEQCARRFAIAENFK